ncbi:hypothetical protein SprV_0100491300 [Sparganum proliferum]
MNHSTLLTPEENRKLKQLVDEEGSLRAVAIVQMYLTDSRLQWKYFKTGVLTLEDSVRNNSVSLCLYDLTAGKRVWHQTLFNEMTYLDSTEQFHYFYGECSAVGLSFADPKEASLVRNGVHFYVRKARTSTLDRLSKKSVGGMAKSVIKRTKSKLRTLKKPAPAMQITYNRQSWQHENHIGYVNGQLQVQGSDRETVELLLKILGSRVTVKNEDEMNAVMDFIHSVGIDKVTNAINKNQNSQTAYSSVSQHDYAPPNTARAPPSSTRPPPPPTRSTRGAPPPPAPPAPPPPLGPHSGGGIPSPDPGSNGGGGFLNDIRNFNKDKLKTTTVNLSRQPSVSSPGGITVDSLGDALAKLLESRRMHLESDTDSDFE